MFKADQEALFQATNIGLTNIRQLEISYYVSVSSAYGTQAALIGGFTYSLFTQNSPSPSHWALDCLTAYYIASITTIALAVHIIMTTMFVQVYGPGLALHGPAGSMAKAAETMRKEQEVIMNAFSLMIFFFASSTVLLCWVVMDIKAAICSSIIFAIAARHWYYYCYRIYYGLYWDRMQNVVIDGKSHLAHNSEEDDDPVTQLNNAKIIQVGREGQNSVDIKFGRDGSNPAVFNTLLKTGSSKPDKNTHAMMEMAPSDTKDALHISKDTLLEGYIAKKVNASIVSRSQYERRYCILTYGGNMFFYKNRQESLSKKSSLNERPLILSDYFVYFGEELLLHPEIRASLHESTDAEIDLLRVVFVSRDKDTVRVSFMVDTKEELQLWKESITKLI